MDLVAVLTEYDNVYIYDKNFNKGQGSYVGLRLKIRPECKNSQGVLWLNYTRHNSEMYSRLQGGRSR